MTSDSEDGFNDLDDGFLDEEEEEMKMTDHKLWIPGNELKITAKLSTDLLGNSYQGKWNNKEINMQKFIVNDEQAFIKELDSASQIKPHPYLLPFLGCSKIKSIRSSTPGDFTYLLYERYFCSLASLRKKDNDALKKYSKDTIITWFCGIAQAMQQLIEANNGNFVHGNLNLTQIKLTVDAKSVKLHNHCLIQFRTITQKSFNDFYWRAPENFRATNASQASDVYSFGIALWEILTRQTPYGDYKKLSLLQRAICKDEIRPKIPSTVGSGVTNLLNSCWQQDPAKRPSWSEVIGALSGVLLQQCIEDEAGRLFWGTYFGTNRELEWKEFHVAFFDFLGLPKPSGSLDVKSKCLQAVFTELEEEKVDKVTASTFGKVLAWFGPLKKGDISVLEAIHLMLTKEWFHGKVGGRDAENLVNAEKTGSFLARFSTSDPGSYAITVKGRRGTRHFRVIHKPGLNYLIGKTELKSMDEIVYKFRDELNLKTPCPGSKFIELLATDKAFSATQYRAWGDDEVSWD